jgi:SAM-dependent methyltransferase
MTDWHEAPPEFYSRRYFLEASAGADAYRTQYGSALDYYRGRVLELARPVRGEVVLDLGCGRGELLLALLRAGCTTYGLDFSAEALDLTRQTIRQHADRCLSEPILLHQDAASADLPPATFDCILATDVVEHILPERLDSTFQRLRASLRPGGRLVIHTSPSVGYLAFGQYVARLLELSKGRRPHRLETLASQLRDGGHCNIQSVRSLRHALRHFPYLRVWAEFSRRQGFTRSALDRLRLTPLLAHHLFAVARRD